MGMPIQVEVLDDLKKDMNKDLEIEIDNGSGFCFGVTTAIRKAEEELAKGEPLYCLGDIVHNGMEVKRLEDKGLITIDHEQMKKLHGVKVLLRAHGEPPETYEIARQNGINIIDATCPVVLALQRRIKKKFESEEVSEGKNVGINQDVDGEDRLGDNEKGGSQIVIFGKNGHAEVLGLVGQTHSHAIVIENLDDAKHKLDFNRNIYLYSQTTKNLDEFHSIIDYIQAHISKDATFKSFDTICRQVANRMPNIAAFASRHDVIIFVAGRKSSNGKVLFKECLSVNPNSHQVEEAEEIDIHWFDNASTVGICGATSTPKWLMEECRDYIKRRINN